MLNSFGRMSVIGALGGTRCEINPLEILFKRIQIHGIQVSMYSEAESQRAFDALCQVLEPVKGKLLIDKIYPFEEVQEAFEYVRHGTLSLYAAFDTRTGEVLGKTTDRHTSQEFVAFLEDLVAHQPEGQEIHAILDNLSAHKTKAVSRFLEEHPQVHLHFTPTYSSWLNQVELWFSKIERDLIHRGVFTSRKDLSRKIMTYIRKYNRHPKPVKWKYDDPSRRITGSTSTVTVN